MSTTAYINCAIDCASNSDTTHPSQASIAKQEIKYGESSDEDLFRIIKHHHSEKAFAELFRRYNQPLVLRVQPIVKCVFLGKEIASDVLSKIWYHRQKIEIAGLVKPYLFRSARNQAIDYLRKSSKSKTVCIDTFWDCCSEYAAPDTIMESTELREEITNLINQLPPKGKRIFLLSRDAGLSYKEIAVKLSISDRTVETHIRRALKSIQRSLRPELQAVLGK